MLSLKKHSDLLLSVLFSRNTCGRFPWSQGNIFGDLFCSPKVLGLNWTPQKVYRRVCLVFSFFRTSTGGRRPAADRHGGGRGCEGQRWPTRVDFLYGQVGGQLADTSPQRVRSQDSTRFSPGTCRPVRCASVSPCCCGANEDT